MGWIIALAVVIGIPALIAFWGIGIYNGLVKLRNGFRNAFAQIDVQLKRRHDLIPNLVETAKGYLAHEKQTLEAVIAARGAAVGARESAAADPGNPGAMKALGQAEFGLGAALGRLMAVAEAYPDLKADQNMRQLSAELSSTENQIAAVRGGYNHAVLAYNNKREVFPSNVIAGVFNFGAADFFEVGDEAQREAPEVKF